MRRTIDRCLVWSLALLGAGCASHVEISKFYDVSAGYQKTVEVAATYGNHNKIEREEVSVDINGRSRSVNLVNGPVADGKQRLVSLSGTQDLAPKKKATVSYNIAFRRLSFLPVENVKSVAIIEAGPRARIQLSSSPKCVHVGEGFRLSYALEPRPSFDRPVIAVSTLGTVGCIRTEARSLRAASGKSLLSATCQGVAQIQYSAPERREIASAKTPPIRIAPSLAPPSDLSVVIGDYAEPEEGGTEGPGQPTPPVKIRHVTLSWSNRSDALQTAVAIYNSGGNVALQESAIQPDTHEYKTSLEVGKDYTFQVRAQYNACVNGEWSSYARHAAFSVPL